MDIPIYDKTQMTTKTRTVKRMVPVTTMQEIEEQVTESVPVTIGTVTVYLVQYRNYPKNVIHIQHAGIEKNRSYGFAFNIPGQATSDVEKRYLPSLAGTQQVYAPGVLTIVGDSARLTGTGNVSYHVPMNSLPF